MSIERQGQVREFLGRQVGELARGLGVPEGALQIYSVPAISGPKRVRAVRLVHGEYGGGITQGVLAMAELDSGGEVKGFAGESKI